MAYKFLKQSPTLLLKQLTQIYEYTHISRLLYAYCTPVTATVKHSIITDKRRSKHTQSPSPINIYFTSFMNELLLLPLLNYYET
jgi:hypothetical protein